MLEDCWPGGEGGREGGEGGREGGEGGKGGSEGRGEVEYSLRIQGKE